MTFEPKVMCPGSDSNRHCMGFESIASCQLGYRGWCNPRLAFTRCVPTLQELGTLMVQHLPGTRSPVSAPDAHDEQPHVPPHTTRVVIAEDEALIRLDLKEMLEEEGYSVVG